MAITPGRYIALSVLAAVAVVWHAFSSREQFFPSMVYLSSSKFSLAVLGNMGFALALASYKLLLRVFLGTLRDSEVERVNDKVGQAVVETCLAMTIFREDFTASFLSMFVVLSFVKIFHWLVQDRVDFIETTPNVSRLQHFRIASFTLVLLAIDLTFLHYSLTRTIQHGVSVHLLFAFEYTVQASTIVLTFIKYCLSMIDMRMEGRWEGKGVAVFYLELTLDMLHLLVYCAFFAVVFSTYGIPLHLVRDLYWTFRNFQTRVRDFLRYRRITANMDQSFPDATEEDLQRADHVCIICREEMNTQGRNKKLSCSHCFHLHCLRSWLERQQNCPICRRSVAPPPRQPAAAAPAAAAAGAAAAGGAGVADPLAGAAGLAQQAGAAGNLAAAQRLQAAHAFHAGHHPPAGGAAAAAAAAAAAQQQHLRRRRGWRAYIAGAAGGDAAAAGAAAVPGVAVEAQYVVAHYPQWVPAAPMALFMPAGGLHPIQYAGQQHPEQVMQAQQQAAAAAAAAAAAGMMAPFMAAPVMAPFMMPPILAPPFAMPAMPGTGDAAAPGVAGTAPTPQQQMAAAAATAAAAASLFAPFGGAAAAGVGGAFTAMPPSTDAATAAASAAAAAAMEQVLQQQLQALRGHQEHARQLQQQQQQQQAAAAAAVPTTTGASSQPPAPAVVPDAAPAVTSPAVVAPAGATGAQASPATNAGSASDASSASSSAGAAGATPAAAAATPAAVPAPAPAQQGEDGEEDEADAIRRRRLERFGGT